MQFAGRFIRGITFSNPRKSNLLLFDGNCSHLFIAVLLSDIDYTVLSAGQERNYMSIQILFLIARNIARKLLQSKGGEGLFRSLRKIYLLSCVEYIAPKVVLTSIDNSDDFQWLSRYYTNAIFYAVQNGTRIRPDPKSRKAAYSAVPAGAVSMLNLMCFGQYEVDLYSRYYPRVDHFYPIGSLIGGYYKYQVCQGRETDYDLCLVSQFRESIMKGGDYPELRKGSEILFEFCRRYVDSGDSVKLIIACVWDDNSEIQYFRSIFDGKAEITPNRREDLTTYHCMDRSHVVLTACSTAAFEAFGWGKKVLFCNFTGTDDYDFDVPEICRISLPDFDLFCKKINYLRGMDERTYCEKTGQSAKYFMNYDPQMPPHRFIREKLFESLK